MMSLFQSQNDVLCNGHFDVDVWYFFDTTDIILPSKWLWLAIKLMSGWRLNEVKLRLQFENSVKEISNNDIKMTFTFYIILTLK